MQKNIRNHGIKTVLLAAALLMLAAPALAQPDLVFVLGTETNHQQLLDASLNATISSIMNVTVYNETNVPSDLSDYDGIFLASLNNATIAGINDTITDAKNNGSDVIAFNLTEDIGNVDLANDTYSNISVYWICGGEENMQRLMIFMGATFCELEETIEDPIRPKVAYLLLSEGDAALVKLSTANSIAEVSVYLHFKFPPVPDLSMYDVIFLERIIDENTRDLIEPMVNESRENNASVITVHCTYSELGNVNHTEHPYIQQYWDMGCIENIERLNTYIEVQFCGLEETIEEPVFIPAEGIYHPDADEIFENLTEYLEWYGTDTGTHHVYNSNDPTIGIVFWQGRYQTGEIDIEDSFIRTIEGRGANVIVAYPPTSILYKNNITKIFMKEDVSAVDAVIDLSMGVAGISGLAKNTGYLQLLDVPVINCIELYRMTSEEWRNSTQGMEMHYFPYQLMVPEIAGEIEAIVVGARDYDPVLDALLMKPIDSQVNWAVNRTLAWINLRNLNNADKKVAIMYYAHAGNDSCLIASYLDVAPSIVNVLDAMRDDGYDVGTEVPNSTELLDLVLKQGKNIGIWVPEALNSMVENYDVELIPESKYLEWFNELPEKKRNEVLTRWGEPPGDLMVYENETGKYIVLPKISLGNVLLTPQPARGYDQNMSALYHDKSIPPTHQYLAFYFWLNKEFDADAIISMGRHGTQEWLPGKGVGLSIDDCWPAIVIQDIPVVYPYIVEGVGEGIMAKRRGSAVMIDHLTPPIVEAGLYGNLSNLEQTIPYYERAENGTLKGKYKLEIIEMCRDLHLDQDLGVDLNETIANETAFEEFLDEVHDYLLEMKTEYMPYGLHIMGRQLSNDSLVSMSRSMLGYEFQEYIAAMNISENQTRMLLEEVILNGTTPSEAQEKVLRTSGDANKTASENMTVLARTVTDENGNYTFSNLTAGNYTVTAVRYTSARGGCWYIGHINTSVSCGEHLKDIEVWLAAGDEDTANEVLNLTDDPDGLTGTSSISGRTVGAGRYVDVEPKANATVLISRPNLDEESPAETLLTGYLTLAVAHADNLRASIIEIPRTLDALDGKYIPPGPGNDPIRDTEVVPTGRNFYHFDPKRVPTKAAWAVGKELADQLLAEYFNETETYPRKVGFILFSGETMRHQGIMESEIFHLLGVKPVWDRRGTVKGVELVPASELGRPRIDVIVTTTGVYRDNWPDKIMLIDEAVHLAAEANDTPNYVKENSELIYEWLVTHTNCTEDEARDLSMLRVFGPPDGKWGTGLTHATPRSSTWEEESMLADLYIGTMSHVYGESIWGEQLQDLFRQNLNGTEIAVFSRSSNVLGILDTDHPYEFLGGLGLAVRSVTGETPTMYINNLRDPNRPTTETLSQFLSRELRTRYFNPHYIEGMMEHDYAGAREIADGFANLWGWEVMDPDTVTNFMWREMYDVYITDKHDLGLEKWFNENNPWARQSIAARMLEAIRKGYWDPSDEVKETLAEEYQKSVEEYGVTCCGHTCGNPLLDDYVSGMLPTLTTDPPEKPDSSGNREGTYPPTPTPKPSAPKSTTNETQSEDISAIPGGAKDIPVIEESEEVVGQVIEKTEMKTDITLSGMELLGLVAVLLVLGLIYAGFRYKKR